MGDPLRVAALVAVVAGALLLAGCNQEGAETTTSDLQPTSAPQTFSLAELAEYDGKEGRPAYVAVDGIVYDLSDSSRWPEGRHSPCSLGAMAGQDLTDLIAKAPAGMRGLLQQMPAVGVLR